MALPYRRTSPTEYNCDSDCNDEDADVTATLKSARTAEDFFGVRHPNRYTGEFDEEGNHIVHGDASGKGAFKAKAAAGAGKG